MSVNISDQTFNLYFRIKMENKHFRDYETLQVLATD